MSFVEKKVTIMLLGRSGCGKGTQSRTILERLKKGGVVHMETGRYLRELLARHENVTIDIGKKLMGRGRFFPYWLVDYLLVKEVVEKGIANRHWVFDGFPRHMKQVWFVEDIIAWHKRIPALCIYIKLSEKEATKRLLGRNRRDDKPQLIKNRMKFFQEDVLPVISYYRKQNRLIEIDGSKNANEVFAAVDNALKRKLGKLWPR